MNTKFAFLVLFSTFAVIIATDPAVPKCTVTNMTIQLVTPGIGLTYDDIKAHLEKEELGFTDPLDSIFSCVDGRSTVAIIGTPGGDSGEFLLALSLYHKYAHPITTDDQVLEILKAFIETEHAHRSFYMHTDSEALEHLAADFAILNPGVTLKLANVSAPYQSAVLSLVTDPSNIGCGHIRNVLKHPDQYEVPSNLTASFIRTFYNYLWNHGNWDDLKLHEEDLTVLEGQHQEQAVLNVVGIVPDGDACADYVPAVVPDNSQNDLFVNHPLAVSSFRSSLAEFFSTLPDAPNAIVFKSYMDALASKQLGLTLGYLASGKPIFQVNITYTAVSSPSTTGVTTVVDSTKGNAAAAISSVLVGIFLVIGGSFAAYFGYVKFNAPKPVAKKTTSKKEEKAQIELETIEDDTKRNVGLEDV